MAAGIADHRWTMEDLIAMMERLSLCLGPGNSGWSSDRDLVALFLESRKLACPEIFFKLYHYPTLAHVSPTSRPKGPFGLYRTTGNRATCGLVGGRAALRATYVYLWNNLAGTAISSLGWHENHLQYW
jgi:hypothetical protein